MNEDNKPGETSANLEAVDLDDLLGTEADRTAYCNGAAAVLGGEFVKDLRNSAGLTQEDLAKKIGVTPGRISQIENGRGTQGPTLGLLMRISAACGAEMALSAGEVWVGPPQAERTGSSEQKLLAALVRKVEGLESQFGRFGRRLEQVEHGIASNRASSQIGSAAKTSAIAQLLGSIDTEPLMPIRKSFAHSDRFFKPRLHPEKVGPLDKGFLGAPSFLKEAGHLKEAGQVTRETQSDDDIAITLAGQSKEPGSV